MLFHYIIIRHYYIDYFIDYFFHYYCFSTLFYWYYWLYWYWYYCHYWYWCHYFIDIIFAIIADIIHISLIFILTATLIHYYWHWLRHYAPLIDCHWLADILLRHYCWYTLFSLSAAIDIDIIDFIIAFISIISLFHYWLAISFTLASFAI
jgi:hypothetical protein